jgi:hypothetical protein
MAYTLVPVKLPLAKLDPVISPEGSGLANGLSENDDRTQKKELFGEGKVVEFRAKSIVTLTANRPGGSVIELPV